VRWWGKAHHEKGLPVMMPGGVQTEFFAGLQHLIALVDPNLLRECVPGDTDLGVGRQRHALAVPDAAFDGLHIVRIRFFAEWLLDGFESQRSRPPTGTSLLSV
jgi:hypothetical protein